MGSAGFSWTLLMIPSGPLLVCSGSSQFSPTQTGSQRLLPASLPHTGLSWPVLVPGMAQGTVGQRQGCRGPQPQGLTDGGLKKGQAPHVPWPRGSLCPLQLRPQPCLQLHRWSTGVPCLSWGVGGGGASQGTHSDSGMTEELPRTPDPPKLRNLPLGPQTTPKPGHVPRGPP